MLKVMAAACTGKERRSRRGAGPGGIRLQGQRPCRCAQQAGTPPQPLFGDPLSTTIGKALCDELPSPSLSLFPRTGTENSSWNQTRHSLGTADLVSSFIFLLLHRWERKPSSPLDDDQLPRRRPTRAGRRTGFSQSWPLHSFFFTVREPGAIRCWSEREQRCWCCGSCEAKNQGPVPGRFPLAGFSRALTPQPPEPGLSASRC